MGTLYVVRHGQTDWNIKRLFQGRMNTPLNETGRKQAEETAKQFENIDIDVILSSPLDRAYDTAKCISKVTGQDIVLVDDLVERSFGDLEGKANRPDCNIVKLLDYEENCNLYNVEPIKSLVERVKKCMDEITSKYKGKNVVIVCHAGVMQAIECYFSGIPDNLYKIRIDNGEIKKYEF